MPKSTQGELAKVLLGEGLISSPCVAVHKTLHKLVIRWAIDHLSPTDDTQHRSLTHLAGHMMLFIHAFAQQAAADASEIVQIEHVTGSAYFAVERSSGAGIVFDRAGMQYVESGLRQVMARCEC